MTNPSTPPDLTTIKAARLADAERIEFGSDAFYHPLLADGDTPLRTGIQTSLPGYQAKMHWHPYLEVLFVIEGEMEAWLEGQEDNKTRLSPGDCVAFPPNIPHSFACVGDKPLRTMGVHHSPERISTYVDNARDVDANGYPVYKPAAE